MGSGEAPREGDVTPKKLKPCGRCSACDEVTFLGLSGRVLDVDSDNDNVSVAEDVLAAMAGRHPFGIAVRLGEVLAELELFEAEGRRRAWEILSDLANDEAEARRLSPGDESLVPRSCSRYARAFPKARRS